MKNAKKPTFAQIWKALDEKTKVDILVAFDPIAFNHEKRPIPGGTTFWTQQSWTHFTEEWCEDTVTAVKKALRSHEHVVSAIDVKAKKTKVVYYAAADDIAEMGPFDTEVEAWKHLEIVPGCKLEVHPRRHVPGAYVFPVEE